jgi:hypothetical protein
MLLGLNRNFTWDAIDDNESAVSDSESSSDLWREVDVAGRIDLQKFIVVWQSKPLGKLNVLKTLPRQIKTKNNK